MSQEVVMRIRGGNKFKNTFKSYLYKQFYMLI